MFTTQRPLMEFEPLVIGTDSGTYYTGKDDAPWTDDPKQAKTYPTPETALKAARQVASAQSEYLEGTPVYLDERLDDDAPTRRLRVAQDDTPLGVSAKYEKAFGLILPPDLFPQPRKPERATEPAPTAATDTPEINEVSQGRERISEEEIRKAVERRRAIEAADQPRAAGNATADAATPTNELARGERTRQADPQQPEAQTQDPAARNANLPAFVRRHFVPDGDQFYYRDKPTVKAFQAQKDSFKANDVSQPVAKALVDLAEQRGWKSLKVKGTAEFKALVWAAAQEKGLKVDGYEPTAGQQAAAEAQARPQQRQQQAPSESAPTATAAQQPEPRERSQETPDRQPVDPYTGEVVAYGPAPYKHQKDGSPSFRVKLRAEDGTEHEHWGVGLEDAMRDSRAKVGDPVTVARGAKRDVEIQASDGTTRTVQRQDWRIEHRAPAQAMQPETAPPPADAPKADATQKPDAPKRDARQEAARQGIADKIADPEARDRAMKTAERHLAGLRARMAEKPPTNEVEAGRKRTADRER